MRSQGGTEESQPDRNHHLPVQGTTFDWCFNALQFTYRIYVYCFDKVILHCRVIGKYVPNSDWGGGYLDPDP